MFQAETPWEMIRILLVWLGIVFGVPLTCLLIYNCATRGFFKRKKDPPENQRHNEPIRCMNCGTTINLNEQACPKCGWTWK